MAFGRAFAATSLFAGLAFGEALTTIDPCPQAPKNITQLHSSITVTAQYQPVSTCTRDARGVGWSTYDWVSTVVPCWGQSSLSSCTVTDTAQVVPCTGTVQTITSTVPTSTALPNGTYKSYNTETYETVSKLWVAPYNEIGPFAIPGFGGCDLCTECGVQADGDRRQKLDVTECTSVAGQKPVCSKYAETWVSQPVPTTTGPVSAAISQHTTVPSAGVYTFVFPQPAPVTSIQSNNRWYTVPAQPWTASVVESFSGPTTYDIVITVTKTVTFNVPYDTSANPKKTSAEANQGWGAWQPAKTTAPVQASSNPNWHHEQSTPSQPKATAPNGSGWGQWTTKSAPLTFSTSSTPTQQSQYPSETSSFYIQVSYNGLQRRYTKRGDGTYVGFSGGSNDASIVNENQNPDKFYFDQGGYLRTGIYYITADLSSGYFLFERTAEKPASPPPYILQPNGQFVRTSQGGFCATSSNFFISISSAPSDCRPVSCSGVDSLSASSGTTSAPGSGTTASTPSSTATPTQPDVSADLDVPEPTSYVRRSNRRY